MKDCIPLYTTTKFDAPENQPKHHEQPQMLLAHKKALFGGYPMSWNMGNPMHTALHSIWGMWIGISRQWNVDREAAGDVEADSAET